MKTVLSDLIQHALTVGEDTDFELDEAVDGLASSSGWPEVLRAVFDILQTPELSHQWYCAAAILSWYWEDRRFDPDPDSACGILHSVNYTIALLYWCLERNPNLGCEFLDGGSNLVWTIASTLKNVGYMSDWDPDADPEIIEIKKRIEEANRHANNTQATGSEQDAGDQAPAAVD